MKNERKKQGHTPMEIEAKAERKLETIAEQRQYKADFKGVRKDDTA